MFLHFIKKCLFVADIVICYIALEYYKPHPWFAVLFSSGVLTSLLNNTCPHLGCLTKVLLLPGFS